MRQPEEWGTHPDSTSARRRVPGQTAQVTPTMGGGLGCYDADNTSARRTGCVLAWIAPGGARAWPQTHHGSRGAAAAAQGSAHRRDSKHQRVGHRGRHPGAGGSIHDGHPGLGVTSGGSFVVETYRWYAATGRQPRVSHAMGVAGRILGRVDRSQIGLKKN